MFEKQQTLKTSRTTKRKKDLWGMIYERHHKKEQHKLS